MRLVGMGSLSKSVWYITNLSFVHILYGLVSVLIFLLLSTLYIS